MTLYELRGLRDLRYSQFSWRTRLALAHKGLEYETIGVRVSDKPALAFSGQEKVPVLVHGDNVIADSWRIAEYLEAAFADLPSLFGGGAGMGLTRFVNLWADRLLLPRLVPLVMVDVIRCVDEEDAVHLRSQIEAIFGGTLERLAEEREARCDPFRKALDPARATLRKQSFLCGEEPAYADYILFSMFQWARLVSAFDPLAEDDSVMVAWRERVLDLHGGAARSQPTLEPASV